MSEKIKLLKEIYKNKDTYSNYLEKQFGVGTAISFALGCELLKECIYTDMDSLYGFPKNTHIGMLEDSKMIYFLPKQFLTDYTFEFLYHLQSELVTILTRIKYDVYIVAHTLLQKIIIYLSYEMGVILLEKLYHLTLDKDSNSLVLCLFGDMTVIDSLYVDFCLTPDCPYHISHWDEQQFYTST